MKKYKLLKPFSFLKKGNEIYVTFEVKRTNLEQSKLKNFAKIYTKNKTYVGEMEILEQGEWLEEVIEKPKSVWDLIGGDSLYFIGSQDIICRGTWDDCNLFLREREIGLIFLTREEAEKELQKRKAIAKIKKYCWENGIDTEHNSETGNSYGFSLSNIGEVVFFDEFRNGNPLGYFSYKDGKKILFKFEEELKIILE